MNYCQKTINKLEHHKDLAPLILRAVIGFFFIMHGSSKIFGGMEGFSGMIGGMGLPIIFAYLVAYGELIGGVMLILGLFTRFWSAYLGIIMIVATFAVKISDGIMNAELDITFLAILISLLFTGPGRYAIDNQCKARKKKK